MVTVKAQMTLGGICASGGASEIKAYHSLQGMLPPGVKGDREETHFLRLNS